MNEIRQKPITFLNTSRRPQLREATVAQIRRERGIQAATYHELVEKVAELAFTDPE